MKVFIQLHPKSFNIWLTVQFSPAAQLCLTLCDPMNHSMPGLPVHHLLLEFTQTRPAEVQPRWIQGIRSGDGDGEDQETIA